MKLVVNKLHPDAIVPKKGLPGDLGIDVCTYYKVVVPAKSSITVDTGLQIGIPEMKAFSHFFAEYFQIGCFIHSKSGLSTKSNIEKGAGVVDPNYTGELKIHLYNHGDTDKVFNAGEKLAQMVFQVCANIDTIEESIINKETLRGDKGFGSQGD